MKKLATVLVVLFLLVVIALGGAWFFLESATTLPIDSQSTTDITFLVPKGANGRSLGTALIEANVVKSPLVWRYFLYRRGTLNAKAGKHLISQRMTLPQIAEALEAPPLVEDEPFVVVEGWRLRDTDKALSEKGWAKPGEYWDAAKHPEKFKAPFPLTMTSLEGYLYPETYRFPVGSFTVEALIQRQLDLFVERFFTPQEAAIKSSGRTLDQIVVMASLLEREESVPAQRKTVAGILWKRFDKSTPLGVDATSRYELEEWNDRKAFLKNLRDEDNAYNSRHKAGLPPTALGATTTDSFLAALHPEDNPYWYYLHDKNKQIHPSRNAAEHEKLRAQYDVY